MKTSLRKKMRVAVLAAAALFFGVAAANATLLTSVFDASWTPFQDDDVNYVNGVPQGEDYVASGGRVYPGWGGQEFDAEYLLYKVDYGANRLYLGVQTGFDISDGQQEEGGKTYYGGDLFVSFDGTPAADAADWEYALDFGWETRGYEGTQTYSHAAGLYRVTTWDNSVYHGFTASTPFAMAAGDLVGELADGSAGYDSTAGSYWRIASISLAGLGVTAADGFNLAAHWTMSCGNDAMTGSVDIAPVPEPATMLLFGTGLVSLAGIGRRRVRMDGDN